MSIIAKIKALRARAADSASSENEAAKAAAVADKLMREHNISLSELDVRADGVVLRVWNEKARVRGPETFAAKSIADAIGVECWVQNGGEITLLGAPADVEVALYYLDLTSNAAHVGLRAYRKCDEYDNMLRYYSPRKIGSDYRIGVCRRLGERIAEQIFAEQTPVAEGTGIVLVKDALVRQWLADNSMAFTPHKSRRRVGASYQHGKDHAENVGIGRGIGVQRTGQEFLTA